MHSIQKSLRWFLGFLILGIGYYQSFEPTLDLRMWSYFVYCGIFILQLYHQKSILSDSIYSEDYIDTFARIRGMNKSELVSKIRLCSYVVAFTTLGGIGICTLIPLSSAEIAIVYIADRVISCIITVIVMFTKKG